MFRGLAALLAGQLVSTLKLKLLVCCHMACSALLAVFAVGYLLDALHALLAFSYGPVTASLIIAGGMLAAAGMIYVLAAYMTSRGQDLLTADWQGVKVSALGQQRHVVRYGTAIGSLGVVAGLATWLWQRRQRTLLELRRSGK